MSVKSKNIPNPSKKSAKQNNSGHRIQISAVLIIVVGIFILLSIFSYSAADEAPLDKLSFVDIFRLPFNEQVKAQTAQLHNRLGLIGALVSDFFVNFTIGYTALVFPVLMILWGWFMLSRREFRKLITFTNYALVIAILFSTTFGVLNLFVDWLGKEWSGTTGAFTADVLTKLLGNIGASIIVVVALFLTTVFAIDLDIHTTLERFTTLWITILSRINAGKHKDVEEGPESGTGVMIRKPEEEIYQQEEPETQVIEERFDEKEPEEIEQINDERSEASLPIELQRQVIVEEDLEEEVVTEPVNNDFEEIDYVFPSVELLDPPRHADTIADDELKANAELVRVKLANFGVEIENVSVTPGPVITLYELVPASGVKISRIVSLADDLALALAAKGIRIMAPIPGKSAVGVEIPNRNPSIVYLRSVINSGKFREAKAALPIALGKTISGEVYTDDLSKMPHLLIAGSTGSGKSVGINTILASLLFRLHPSEVKFVIIDPKKIELTQYGKLKNHFLAVSPDNEEEIITSPENAVNALRSVELEMEKRYERLAAAGVRNILDYNDRFKAGRLKNTETIIHRKIPYLVLVIDELADLMMTAAREVEEPIARLAQLARAVGIHLVLATQRPSVDVITGVIKANFPARIAYQVASKTDSRTILDMNGAEQLLGNGDMLYLPSGSPKPVRIQNAFLSTDEVERLTEHIARQQGYSKSFQLPSVLERKRASFRGTSNERDEFFEEAARLIVRHQQGSVSLLQRRLKVGYSRAARLVDELEAVGIVGPFDGSKAREVLIENEQELDGVLKGL